MARPKDSELERLWRQRFLHHSTSGLSITEFCVQAGVPCSSFVSVRDNHPCQPW